MKTDMSQRILSWGQRDTSQAPLLLAFRSSKRFIVSSCCLAVFTDLFLYSIVVPVLPFALTARAGIPPEDVQYWTSALIGCYAGGMLVASPICGWFIDRSPSRRLPFVLGLLAIGGSTVLLCVGSSISVLVVGRLLEGLSSALISTCGPTLLVDTVDEKEIGKAMGYFSLCSNLAVLAGPVIGGTIFARSGYLAVFAMAFGLIGIDIVLRLALVEKKVAAKWNSTSNEEEGYWISNYDIEGPPNITPSSRWNFLQPLGFHDSGFHNSGFHDSGFHDSGPHDSRSNDSRSNDSGFVETMETYDSGFSAETYDSASSVINHQAVSTTWTTFYRSNYNLPPVITLLRSRRLLAALWGSLVQATVMCAFDAVLPLFVHRTFGWSSMGAGLIFLPICIPSFAAPLVGRLADKHGPKWLVAAGFTTSFPCLVLLRLVTHHALQQIVLLCALLSLLGMSLTLMLGPLVAEIAYLVKAKEERAPGTFGTGGAYAQAFGLYYCWFAGGLLIGPIWAGYAEQTAGWGTVTWSLALLSGVTAIPILIFTGRTDRTRSD